jgi:hypothetical protein
LKETIKKTETKGNPEKRGKQIEEQKRKRTEKKNLKEIKLDE